MKTILRSLLVLIAFVSVGALGYYAYILETGTLAFPFQGQEKQSWYTMQFVVAKPRFLLDTYDGDIVDSGAIIKSLKLNWIPFDPTISSEWTIIVSWEYINIWVQSEKKDFRLTLDSDAYNSLRSTKYRLLRDMTLTWSENPRAIEIIPTGLPRERMYSVNMYWYPGLDPDDLRWYIHNDPKLPCDIRDSWDSLEFERLKVLKLTSTKVSQIDRATYILDYDTNNSRVCIIAWLGWDFQTIVDRNLSSFSATWAVVDMLSPEYDMKSQVEFRFTEDIYSDTGALYSSEYIKNRSDAKIAFLKQLEIVPNIPLTESSITLSPSRATIIGDFAEWQKYTITLRDISDVYGRKVSTNMSFTPIKKPFLSLWLENRRTIFKYGEPIHAKLYALKAPKNEYSVKLCRISLEWYAKAERMIGEWKKEYTESLYNLLSSSDTSNCVKKDIVLSSWSLISPFDVREFSAEKSLSPWLYILAFRNPEDVTGFEKFVAPRVFSIVDSHITMKVDASGKMSFLVTDIRTGKPLWNQAVTISQNISKTFTERWDQATWKYITTYIPLSSATFSQGITLGQTDIWGFLETRKEKIKEDDYNTPYSLSYEYPWEEYGWWYHSFIATSVGEGHFGYVVSTWNDGITGWNFWLKESDYAWDTRPEYSAYIHTDRRLYLPWEKVYVHAILRKNDATLAIPTSSFVVQVTDPSGVEIKNVTMQPNEYGTLSFDFSLDKEASLWSYNVNITPFENINQFGYVSNGYTSFQVEVFKNPTFTAKVELKSPDIEDGYVTTLRKKVNTNPDTPWYTDVYNSVIALEWIVSSRYYNGAEMRWVPFRYRIYRNQHFSDNYWNDCFWWCYWEPSPEFYTEWTWSIDSDGMWFFRVPVDFSSYYGDYMYTAEVTITDPMTGEEVVTPGTILAKMPVAYKNYAYDNPVDFIPVKKILKSWEKIQGQVKPRLGSWDSSLSGKYQYQLIHREYQSVAIDDLRMSYTTIPVTQDKVITTGALSGKDLTIDTRGIHPGEYHLRVFPISESKDPLPESSISDALLYIAGDFVNGDSQLRVIPEKTVYRLGEKARVLITTPFTWGYLYITREKWWVIDHEYVSMSGNTLLREYLVDDSMVPNAYIGAVALSPLAPYGKRSYSVWYGEIVTDLVDKKGKIEVTPNKSQYSNREEVSLDIAFTDRFWNPLQWEVALMVVDESLIRLLGNIDLDIIPKFFQKIPFTMKTSLSAIWMERNRFLSRKWSNWWSGDKWGWGVEISSRVLFKNTAYYNPSVITDSTGRAKTSFVLPDNVTDYRIIAIAQTKDSRFAVSEKTIAVRRDYTLESRVPYIVYPWDTTTIVSSAFNSTKKVTSATVLLSMGTGETFMKKEQNIVLNPGESKSVEFSFSVPENWKGKSIWYTITLVSKDNILDSVTKTLRVPEIPLLESTFREFGVFTGATSEIFLPKSTWLNLEKSRVVLRVSSSLLIGIDSAIKTLIQYPYGCIEQTISSTLPNALAIKFQSLIWTPIDSKKAQENLEAGIKKIVRMQHYSWGWKYWEQDDFVSDHVTPYVIRSLYLLQDLGFQVPQDSLNNGVSFITSLIDNGSSLFESDPDFRAEVFWTLSRAKNERALILQKAIDPKKLSRHGYLAYAYWLHYAWKYSDETHKQLTQIMSQDTKSDYWYWDSSADKAIYASLLLDRGDTSRALEVLQQLMWQVDLSSYYVSTQTKIQLLSALIKYSNNTNKNTTTQVAARAQWLIADLSLSSGKMWQKVETFRSKVGDSIKITREGGTPTFYEIIAYDLPSDIFSMKPIARGNIEVSRVFEKIDESRWVNAQGVFVAATPVTDGIFERWQLYRVTLTVSLPNYVNKSWHHLTLEDFVPGWWRPIRGIFKTESVFTSDVNNGYHWNGWSHVEAKDDRILATSEWWYGENQTYTYYFRPEFSWTYLLPPVTAYFMYRPEVFAIGRYQKVTVK